MKRFELQPPDYESPPLTTRPNSQSSDYESSPLTTRPNSQPSDEESPPLTTRPGLPQYLTHKHAPDNFLHHVGTSIFFPSEKTDIVCNN